MHKGNSFSGPFRPRPVIEAYSRRANHQFTLVVLIEILHISIKYLLKQTIVNKGYFA